MSREDSQWPRLLLKSPPLGSSLFLQLAGDEAHKMLCTKKSLRQSLFCMNLAVFPYLSSLLGFPISFLVEFTNLDSGLCQLKREGLGIGWFLCYILLHISV